MPIEGASQNIWTDYGPVGARTGFTMHRRPVTNNRFIPALAQQLSTSNTLGNGSLRLTPAFFPYDTPISHFALDITVAGEAGSTVRFGIYHDNGDNYPGALLRELGVVAGDAITVAEVAVSGGLVIPAGFYWIGGAVQGAPTTQPTVRVTTGGIPGIISGGPLGANSSNVGYQHTGATAALPATFTSTILTAGAVPRAYFRVG